MGDQNVDCSSDEGEDLSTWEELPEVSREGSNWIEEIICLHDE